VKRTGFVGLLLERFTAIQKQHRSSLSRATAGEEVDDAWSDGTSRGLRYAKEVLRTATRDRAVVTLRLDRKTRRAFAKYVGKKGLASVADIEAQLTGLVQTFADDVLEEEK